MTKILSLVPYKIFPAIAGGQKNSALFNDYLSQECSLVCVTVKSNEPQYAKDYELLNVLSNAPSRYINLFYFFTLRSIIRRYRITHLVIEHPYYGWLGLLLQAFTPVRLVVHSQNIESTRWKSLGKWWWKILWWYEGWVHRRAAYNFFITDEDTEFALLNFHLRASACTTVPYGITLRQIPLAEERKRCKETLRRRHGIAPQEAIFLFNGALDYKPNYHAVEAIVEKINPLLLQQGFAYKIIICGKGLPAGMNELKAYTHQHIIYAGFVDDIDAYFKAADVFMNPVVEGGGVKTKLVEALGYNSNAVSTMSGAWGINPGLTNGKLSIVPDSDWAAFAKAAVQIAANSTDTPQAFFEHFYWGNIISKVVGILK